jgi:endoglucanase
VKNIFPDGFMSFEKVGTAVDKIMPGRKVLIKTKSNGIIPGIIGIKAGHLQTDAERNSVQKASQLFLDVAAVAKGEVEAMGIRIGDRFVIESDFTEMHNRDYVCTKAIDDRVACVAIIQLFDSLNKVDFPGAIVGAITSQEEFSFMGARTISDIVKPDCAIVLDTIPCVDTPDCNPAREHPVWMGKGPVCALDFGVSNGAWFHFIHPKVREMIEDASLGTDINIQYLTSLDCGYTTDAPEVSFGNGGTPTGTLAIARRYSHSPVEIMNLNDAVDLVELMTYIAMQNGGRSFEFL